MNKPLLKPYGALILCMKLPRKSLGVQWNDEGKHMAIDLNQINNSMKTQLNSDNLPCYPGFFFLDNLVVYS